jgi:hypothetical protein
MKFSKEPPRRKRKHYPNPVTEHPAFIQLLKAMRKDTARASLTFASDDAKTLGVKFPWRVAADALRRIIRDEHLPYTSGKYRTEEGGWAVRVTRTAEKRARTEEGPSAKSA